MPIRTIIWTAAACVVWLLGLSTAHAQVIEAVGERALGMGGAFVAVANDSSAVWWNPAALADGPFFDLSIGRAVVAQDEAFPAGRHRVSGFALTTPVIGAHLWRQSATTAHAGTTEGVAGGRQDEEVPRTLRKWTATSLGATVVQTVVDGTHVGATVKYVRGTVQSAAGPAVAPEMALDAAGALQGGNAEGRFELDIGGLATAGPVRLGVLLRNVRGSEFGRGAYVLPRQVRLGIAYSTERDGGRPLTIAFDADVREYEADGERRRVVAFGAEQWLAAKRVGLRAGARVDTAGAPKRVFAAGISLALRQGSYLEAHASGGNSPAEQGWGTGVRVSF